MKKVLSYQSQMREHIKLRIARATLVPFKLVALLNLAMMKILLYAVMAQFRSMYRGKYVDDINALANVYRYVLSFFSL